MFEQTRALKHEHSLYESSLTSSLHHLVVSSSYLPAQLTTFCLFNPSTRYQPALTFFDDVEEWFKKHKARAPRGTGLGDGFFVSNLWSFSVFQALIEGATLSTFVSLLMAGGKPQPSRSLSPYPCPYSNLYPNPHPIAGDKQALRHDV